MFLTTTKNFFLEHGNSKVSASLQTPKVPGSSPGLIFSFFFHPYYVYLTIFNTALIFFLLSVATPCYTLSRQI